VEYHLFVDGVKPMWEDSGNKGGSRIMMRIKKGSTNVFWEELLLAFIGGAFEAENTINGIVVSTKNREDSLAIWLNNQADQTAKNSISTTLR
jgi:translation initiation factor 4E